MRLKLVLKVFAESETTGDSVELCPGGLVEEHPSIDSLLMSLTVACEQGWGDLNKEELDEVYTRLRHEAGAIKRLLVQRERAGMPGSVGEGKESRRKATSKRVAGVS